MELPTLLIIISLLLSSVLWQLHAQEDTSPTAAPEAVDIDTTILPDVAATTTLSSSALATTPVDTDTEPAIVLTTASEDPQASTSAAPLVSTAPSLHTTTADAQPTTPTLPPTTPETTQTTAQQETTTPAVITAAPVEQGTSPSPLTSKPTTSRITSAPPPTTPTVAKSTSTSAPPKSTPAVTTTAESIISTTAPVILPPVVIPAYPPPPAPETTTCTGTTESSGTESSGTATSGTSTIGDPALVGGLSPGEEPGEEKDKPAWVWVVVVGLVAALASVACIALLIKRRKQKRESGLGHNGMNGRSQRSQKKRKKGEEDAWAGPVLMAGAEKDEGNGYNGDEEDNNDGEPADGTTQPMLSTFALLSEDEEKAVGADGTKEAKKWEEQSPLLYIDEDVEDEVDEGTPVNQKLLASSQGGQSTGRTQAEGSEKKGEAMAETGAALNGAVAFCQTTAV